MKREITEKILNYGATACTNSELLSIFLGGNDDKSIDKAREILGKYVITDLISKPDTICSTFKIRKETLIKFLVLSEMHKRLSKEYALQRFKVTSPSAVANIFMEEMRWLSKEHIKILFLDTKNGIICDRDISIGTVNASLVDPREVFKEALKYEAVNIILIHNHPSGDPEPSRDDIEVTKRCVNAGKMIGINVLDHIIVGDGSFKSLKELGLGHLS